jgi:hypothetical protein
MKDDSESRRILILKDFPELFGIGKGDLYNDSSLIKSPHSPDPDATQTYHHRGIFDDIIYYKTWPEH